MTVNRSIDIEAAVRTVLSEHFTAYCPPLPAKYELPNLLITATGGDTASASSGKGKVDTFMVVLDARADTEESAMDYIRNAVAVLETADSSAGISHVAVNSLYSWGADAVRPDLAMCSATLMVTAHRETVTL